MQGVFLREYGVASTLNFDLVEADGINFRVDAVPVSGDSKIMKDEGVEANTANLFADEGNGYSLPLTAEELTAARLQIYLIDSATKVWLDKSIVIETYGNASAQHAMNFNTTVPTVIENRQEIDTNSAMLNTISGDVAGLGGAVMRGTDNSLLAANVPINFSSLGIESDGDLTKVNLCANTTLVNTVTTNTDMRGTNSAALASVATEARLAELDAAKLPATTDRNETALAFISGDTAAILVDTNQMQGKLPTNNFMGSSVTTDKDGEIDSILAESRHISGDLVIVSGDTAAILVDTNQMQGKLPVNNFMGSSVTTDKDDEIDAIKAVTDNLPNSGALNDLATNLAETRHISGDLVLVSGDTVAIKAKTDNLPEGIKKNTAYSNFQFFMRDTSDHVSAKTGLSVSSNRSIDGGAFASTANSPSEISNGFYKIDLDAADLNGDTISFRFSATGADDTAITIITNV